MSRLFYQKDFVGGIGTWDVSGVVNMNYMFERSKFNGDIVLWYISSVKNMG